MRSIHINPFFVCLVNTSVADECFSHNIHAWKHRPLGRIYQTNIHTIKIHVYLSILSAFVSQNVRIGFAPHLVQNQTSNYFFSFCLLWYMARDRKPRDLSGVGAVCVFIVLIEFQFAFSANCFFYMFRLVFGLTLWFSVNVYCLIIKLSGVEKIGLFVVFKLEIGKIGIGVIWEISHDFWDGNVIISSIYILLFDKKEIHWITNSNWKKSPKRNKKKTDQHQQQQRKKKKKVAFIIVLRMKWIVYIDLDFGVVIWMS